MGWNVPQSQNDADDSAEAHASRDPHFSPDKQLARRSQAGIASGESKRFGENCEFVSVGCFCAVAHALQSLGLKQYTYPFDWNRSPSDGVMHCLQTNFSDFLDYGFVRDEGHKGKLFGGTAWGGSFWHHDITKPKVRADFKRRIERFYGRKEVAACKTRVFVRAVNSTSELASVLDFQRVLQEALPDAKIFLLDLVDLQTSSGLMSVSGAAGDNILFARIHESLFAQCTRHWSIEKHSNAYSEAIAQAVQWWAGDRNMSRRVAEFESLQDMFSVIDPFDGGSTKDQLFTPVRSGARPVAPSVNSLAKPAPLPIGRARLNTGQSVKGDASPTMRSGDMSPATPTQSPRLEKPSLSPSRRRDPGTPGSCSAPVSPCAQSEKCTFNMEGSAKVTEEGSTSQSQSSSKPEQIGAKTPSAPPLGQAAKRDNASPSSDTTRVASVKAPSPKGNPRCHGAMSPPVPGSNETAKPSGVARSNPSTSESGPVRMLRPVPSAGVGGTQSPPTVQSPFLANASMPRSSSHRALGTSSQLQSTPGYHSPLHSGFSSRGFMGSSFYGSARIP